MLGAGRGVYFEYTSMLDWLRVTGFDWDHGNSRKSSDKHAVSQGKAEQIFFNPLLLVVDDAQHGMHEERHHALGKTDAGRRLHVTFTLRRAGVLICVISARDMSRKERTIHEQA